MKSEFEIAITQLCSDRNLAPEVILEAIEAALISAYKRNYGANQNIDVTLDPHTGQARVFIKKQVVEQVEDDGIEMTLDAARAIRPDAAIGEFVDIEVKPRNFGRIAAQTAKQVIMQRIREAERDSVYLEYADRSGEIVNGVVRNIDSRSQNVTLSLGKAEALLPRSEQIPGEQYRFNQRLRVYVVEVERTGHGPQISVSRTHRGLLRRLLELEVPEILTGGRGQGDRARGGLTFQRWPWPRCAWGRPVGSCVGMRGVRIQNIVNELSGEKIDVVPWAPTSRNSSPTLSPAKVVSAHLNEDDKTAKVVVPDRSSRWPSARGAERPAGRQADGLADRHPQRDGGRRGGGAARGGGPRGGSARRGARGAPRRGGAAWRRRKRPSTTRRWNSRRPSWPRTSSRRG